MSPQPPTAPSYGPAASWLGVAVALVIVAVGFGGTVGIVILLVALFPASMFGNALGVAYTSRAWMAALTEANPEITDGIMYEQDDLPNGRVATTIFPSIDDPGNGIEYQSVALSGEPGKFTVVATRRADNERDARRNHNELLAKVG